MEIATNDTMALARAAHAQEIEAAQQVDSLERAYQAALEREGMDSAADIARQKRDALLKEVDAHGSVYRVDMTAPTGTTFTSFLPWLKKLAALLTDSPWATYRRALLDVPQQEGFPAAIVWPDKPTDGGTEQAENAE